MLCCGAGIAQRRDGVKQTSQGDSTDSGLRAWGTKEIRSEQARGHPYKWRNLTCEAGPDRGRPEYELLRTGTGTGEPCSVLALERGEYEAVGVCRGNNS